MKQFSSCGDNLPNQKAPGVPAPGARQPHSLPKSVFPLMRSRNRSLDFCELVFSSVNESIVPTP